MYSDSQVLANNLSHASSLYGGTSIPNNADMHDYIIPGNYHCQSYNGAQTLVNCPVKNAFKLEVVAPLGNKDGSYILQKYMTMDGVTLTNVAYDPYNKTWKSVTLATKSDLTPAFAKVGSGYGLEAYHAAIGKLHILRLAGNVTSAFSNFNLALPDSCDGYFISEPGKVGDISYTIEINSKHLIVTSSTSVPVGKYFVHWLIYYGY